MPNVNLDALENQLVATIRTARNLPGGFPKSYADMITIGNRWIKVHATWISADDLNLRIVRKA